jgi:hypothetical protein
MTANPAPRLVSELKPQFEVKVDLDDRAFLFPAGKPLVQLLFCSDGRRIFIDAIYPFNQTRTPPRLLDLHLEDARELGRGLVQAVHFARTQLVVTEGLRVSINVVANGYHLQIGDMNKATEIFLSTACIWRVCQGLLRIVDLTAPVESN